MTSWPGWLPQLTFLLAGHAWQLTCIAQALCEDLTKHNSKELMNVLTSCYFINKTETFNFVDIRADDGRYFNHTRPPNVGCGSVVNSDGVARYTGDEVFSTYALRNIAAGEARTVQRSLRLAAVIAVRCRRSP